MEDYLIPISFISRERPLEIKLRKLGNHFYVFASLFAPFDEADRDVKELEVQPFKPGLLAVAYYDLYQLRVRVRVMNKMSLPIGLRMRIVYDMQLMAMGELVLLNTFSSKQQMPQFFDIDVSNTRAAEPGNFGITLDAKAEARAFAAMGIMLGSRWGAIEAFTKRIAQENAEKIEALSQVYLYSKLKSDAAFNRRCRMLTQEQAKTPQMRYLYSLGWACDEAVDEDYSRMPQGIRDGIAFLEKECGIRVIP